MGEGSHYFIFLSLAGQIEEFWQQIFDVLLQVLSCIKKETAVSVNGVLLKEFKNFFFFFFIF